MNHIKAKRHVETINSVISASSVDLKVVEDVIAWSPEDWDCSTLANDGRSVVEELALRKMSDYLPLTLNLVRDRGGLTADVWVKTLINVYCFHGQGSFDNTKEAVVNAWLKAWHDIGDKTPGAWEKSPRELIATAFNKHRWAELDYLLGKTKLDVNSLIVKTNGWPSGVDLPILQQVPCLESLEILIKHGGIVTQDCFSAVSNLNEHSFDTSAERRAIVVKMRSEVSKNEVTSTEGKQKIVWETIKNAKSWMDIQNLLKEVGDDIKTMKGDLNENALFHLMLSNRDLVFNLNRSKYTDKTWWEGNDSFGCDISHYNELGASFVRNETEKLIDGKIKDLIYIEDWDGWHQKLWKLQDFLYDSSVSSSCSFFGVVNEHSDLSKLMADKQNSVSKYIENFITLDGFEYAINHGYGALLQKDPSIFFKFNVEWLVNSTRAGSFNYEKSVYEYEDVIEDFREKRNEINKGKTLINIEKWLTQLQNKPEEIKDIVMGILWNQGMRNTVFTKEPGVYEREVNPLTYFLDLNKLAIENGVSWNSLKNKLETVRLADAKPSNMADYEWYSMFKSELKRKEAHERYTHFCNEMDRYCLNRVAGQSSSPIQKRKAL